MICRRCLLRISRPSILAPSSRRAISNTLSPAVAESISTESVSQAKPESNATQPFTTPLSISPTGHGEKSTSKKSESPVILSSIPAGTPLKGLNFLKNKTDPVAMEDSEYPAWLWDVLKSRKGDGGGVEDGDLYSKSKTKRQKAKKALKQGKLSGEDVFVKVPLYEQTIDLPAGDGTVEGGLEAAKARMELTKAMRGKRRATIKEANFLRTMG